MTCQVKAMTLAHCSLFWPDVSCVFLPLCSSQTLHESLWDVFLNGFQRCSVCSSLILLCPLKDLGISVLISTRFLSNLE